MIFLQYGIFLAVLLVIVPLFFFLCKKYPNFQENKFFKIVSIVLAVLFVARYMTDGDALQNSYALWNINFSSKFGTFVALIVNWFMYGCELLLILFPFFNKNFTKNIIKFFVFPFSILAMVALSTASIGIVGQEGYNAFNFRAIIMAIEFAIVLAYSFLVFWKNDKFKIDKKEGLKLLYIIPLMLLAVMPVYTIQGLFGFANLAVKIKGLNVYHRVILYIAILIPVALYFMLRKKDKEYKRLCLLFIALGTLLSFSVYHKFPTFLDVTAWPFHLCNTAMYLMVLCLVFKWEKLFYFTLFINVLGAFLAMIMPNYSDSLNLFSSGLVNFYVNHYIAFFMPILIVALGVYQRPKLRQFIYSIIGFAGYFVLMLILNALFTGMFELGWVKSATDYFFINSDFIADKLGAWAENLRNVVLAFNIGPITFTFYPVYQILFFLVYVAMGAGMWFVYEWAYQGADFLKDMSTRKQKIKLDQLALEQALNGRSEEEPMNLENVNKVVLRNFSKRYGNSNVYAVKDANLTINGGEIFGFLGPNGAGKSTIIKSIVGIQPITEGSIEVCGYDVDKQSVMAKRQIGFVPDHYALYEKLTGREYINYIADLYNVSQEDRDKAIEKYVNLLQLNEAFDNQMQTYSHGMKQKISIISALVHNPKVWILDEPLIGLDPTSIFQVKECLKNHAREGNIVFFSSHIIDVVERVCDKIAIIKNGHILVSKDVKDFDEDQSLEKFYLDTINNINVEHTKVSKEEMEKTRKTRKEELRADREEMKKQRAEKKTQKQEKKRLKKENKKGE